MAIARVTRGLRIALALTATVSLPGEPRPGPDLLVPKSGPRLRGMLVKRSETEVVFSPYGSRDPGMTYEVVASRRTR